MRRAFLAVVVSAALVACGSAAPPDDHAIVQAFQNHQSQVEVTADGTVVQVLPDRAGSSGPHERFIIKLTSFDLTLLIEHNLSIGARAPVAVGDRVIVHGEYIWNSQGGLIHFTHHDPEGRHEGGFIQDNGTTYD
jgi:hypothetical protein